MHWVITVNTNTKYLTVPIVNMIKLKIARYSYKEYLCFLRYGGVSRRYTVQGSEEWVC